MILSYYMVSVMKEILNEESQECEKRRYFDLPDFLVIGIVLCAVVFVLLGMFSGGSDERLEAVVSVGGKVSARIPLSDVDEGYTYEVEGYNHEIVNLYITDESVEFSDSPCPDKLCVNTGKLTKAGDSAVCLPQRVSVKLVDSENSKNDQPDAVAG